MVDAPASNVASGPCAFQQFEIYLCMPSTWCVFMCSFIQLNEQQRYDQNSKQQYSDLVWGQVQLAGTSDSKVGVCICVCV
jgi:hypothetical protein